MFNEALTAFDFAIISDDTFIGAYFEKGKVLEKLGKFNEDIENYETTIKIEDPTSHAYLRIGKCYERLCNDEMAKYYYYQTVHEDPLLDKGWLAITDFYFNKGNYEKALYYINKALNIDGENPTYWKKSARINAALQNYDQADYSFKQAVDLGNYELDTWLGWASAVKENKDYTSGLQILAQGQEFYPESAEILYKIAGFHLLANDKINARIRLIDALKNNSEKLQMFQEEFPQYFATEWAQNIIAINKRASR